MAYIKITYRIKHRNQSRTAIAETSEEAARMLVDEPYNTLTEEQKEKRGLENEMQLQGGLMDYLWMVEYDRRQIHKYNSDGGLSTEYKKFNPIIYVDKIERLSQQGGK